MLATLRLKALNFFTKGHERTLKAKKNIAISFLLKGVSIGIGLVLIPMTINYVDTTQYGIWLTLSSVISWFSFFDIGFGNGLKNKLAEANAIGDTEKARIYISTTYAILGIISIFIFVTFFFLNQFINWGKVLNTTQGFDLGGVVLLIVGFFCFQFVVQLINIVLTAIHVPSKVSAISVIGQFCCLCCLFVLTQKSNGSLKNLVLILAGVPLLIQVIASIWLYNTSYKSFSPGIKFINFKYAKNLLSIGVVFFMIQIGALVLFQTDNIVITQLFGPKEVTTFNIAYKLFSVIIMACTIIITPYWSAFTDAFINRDFIWMKMSIYKMRMLWIYLSIGTVLLLSISKIIYKLWLGDSVIVRFSLSIAMALYVITYVWQTIHVYMLNGIGKVRLQLILIIVCAIINIPLAILLGKSVGLIGIISANTILFLIMGIVFSIQCEKILDQKATKLLDR